MIEIILTFAARKGGKETSGEGVRKASKGVNGAGKASRKKVQKACKNKKK